ncbi:hypothetical protein ACHAW5_008443 [Stephanodiscus triporus]|uniref:Uncharacterized protein n=1 Tax=Stephanodiscus triporus TaxID=2934178 RepID=A0ABD3MK17_9STRA
MTNSSTAKVPPLLVFLCLLSGTSPVTADENDSQRPSSPQLARRIRTLMCASESCDVADEGTSGCRAYTTPLNACYNARFLFPGDESWGDSDVFDEMIMGNIKRTFYRSGDGSCAGRGGEGSGDAMGHNGDDSFVLPLDECVGPFGPPRPWGKFTLLFDRADRAEDFSATGRK